MRSNTEEMISKEVRAALDHPRARQLVVGALLMRENRKSKIASPVVNQSPNSAEQPKANRR